MVELSARNCEWKLFLGTKRELKYPFPNHKRVQTPFETLGLFLIPGAFFGSLCGALCGSLLLPLALGLSAEGLISYSLIFLLLGEGVYPSRPLSLSLVTDLLRVD